MTLHSATDMLSTSAYDQQQQRSRSSTLTSKERPDSTDKDRFIELAQAALEEAHLEEERKGVLQEVIEALVSKTGAPLVADVISQQLHSQDVIERLCELHQQQQEHSNQHYYWQKDARSLNHNLKHRHPCTLVTHDNDTQRLQSLTAATTIPHQEEEVDSNGQTATARGSIPMLRAESVESMKAPDDEKYENKTDESYYYNVYDDDDSPLKLLFMLHPHYRSKETTAYVVAEYLWRLFRLLLLASLVGLVCHFLNSTSTTL